MARLLDAVNSPADLKGLTFSQLDELAEEIRQEIITTVSHRGGHLAANLGVVELTIALHSILDSPQDKIIWDVGHQTYAHKLLTGRRDQFASLRQHGGLSGFPRRSESSHDVFGTGHSSTSVSAALGLAEARDLLGEDYHVVAVIGDGALGAGLAFEALNHAGHRGTDLVVVLNDNEMSIDKNVGALARYLTQLRMDPTLYKARTELENLLKQIPAFGGIVHRAVDKLKDGLKQVLVPGMFFEELGFSYYGPLNGHNIGLLRWGLRDALAMKGPVLLHVVTTKGKGHPLAERNPKQYHGISAASSSADRPSNSQVFGEMLCRLAKNNERIVAVTAAMAEGTGLSLFQQHFPDRFFDVGIAEQHALTLAAGLAAGGQRPVVALYSTFLQRGYDQLIHDICLQELPVVLAVDRSGLVGEDGPTHHGVFDLSFLRIVPGLVILAPKDGKELEDMLAWALTQEGPVAICYPRGTLSPLGYEEPIVLGRGQRLRTGKDLNFIALGSMVGPCQAAAKLLAQAGVDAGVVNARFVKPLDVDLIQGTPGYLITVEENVLMGGFGSAVLEACGDGRFLGRIGLPDSFVEHGPQSLLHEKYGLTPEAISAYAHRALCLAREGRKSLG
ncbi:MAG: 1-deoxy-D-xylulose-5-phosphate synthase [Limnochordia bacterium]|jgi:1-deoxy-D-xylulose-5-phosphate synthase